MTAHVLEFRDATLGYGRRAVLEHVSFAVPRGAWLGIVGPNGSGKTTLLRAALGLSSPLSGSVVRADGGALRIGYVPQRARLDPVFPLSVRDVVTMGRYPHLGPLRRPGASDRAAVESACGLVAIQGLLDRPFRDLSGGQQQRTLIARALAAEPDLLVLDEPTNGMDLASERAIVDVLASLHRERGTTILFVTHLLNLVVDEVSALVILQPTKDGVRLRAGGKDEILTADVLSDIYGVPVDVHALGDRRVILARSSGPDRSAP